MSRGYCQINFKGKYKVEKRIHEIIKLHQQFWSGETMDSPLVSFKIAPDYFFSTHFKASRALLIPGKEITPDMIDVDEFIKDYQKAADEIDAVDQDGFWTAEPFVGFPWMEAICGCKVYATESSYISHHCLSGIEEYEKIIFDSENPWFKKYMEFTVKLFKEFKGRYFIGQPILRGMSDVVGALIGQTEMIYTMYDYPEEVKKLMSRIADIFLHIIKSQQDAIEPLYGGYSMGFYHLWSPGRCMWFQEDLTSLMSPDQYREFLAEQHEKILSCYDYTGIHLHSSSFHVLEDLLSLERLKVIEINKDIGGLTVEQMMPVFKRVQQKGKKLMVWGDLNNEEIDMIKNNLDMKGLHFNIIAPGVPEAVKLLEHIRK